MTPAFTTGPVRIAYDVIGQGAQTLLVTPGWVSHLDYDWATPEIRTYYQHLAAGRRRVIRYDKRGAGLSDRPAGADTYGIDAQVSDIAAVLDAVGAGQVAVLGWSQGGPIAIAFAARHPDHVSHLVLYGTYARLVAAADYPHGRDPNAATQQPRTEDRSIWDLIFANIGYSAIMVAHDLKLFRLLAERPRTTSEVAQALGIAARPADTLLTTCVALGFARVEDGCYALTPVAEEYLVDTSPTYLGRFLDALTANHAVFSFDAMKRAVLADAPQVYGGDALFESHEAQRALARAFTHAVHGHSARRARLARARGPRERPGATRRGGRLGGPCDRRGRAVARVVRGRAGSRPGLRGRR